MYQVGKYDDGKVIVYLRKDRTRIYKDNNRRSNTYGKFFDKYPGSPNVKEVKLNKNEKETNDSAPRFKAVQMFV